MSAPGDLTTIANVKAWRTPPIANGADDAQLAREITAASKALLQYLNRKSLAFASYNETRNGQGTNGLMLRNYPIIGVTKLMINGLVIPASVPPCGYGYVVGLDDEVMPFIYLRGFIFPNAPQSVNIQYTAGLVQTDAAVVPATPFQLNCSTLSQLWCTDGGVTYANGTPFVAVKATPAVGHYVPPAGPDGYYLFNTGDASAAINVTYGWTPKDIEEAVIQMVILEYNRRGRIGENTKSLAAETVSYYSTAALTPTVKSRLSTYMNVVPNV